MMNLAYAGLNYFSAKALGIKSGKVFWGTLSMAATSIVISIGAPLIRAPQAMVIMGTLAGSIIATKKITKMICGEEYTPEEQLKVLAMTTATVALATILTGTTSLYFYSSMPINEQNQLNKMLCDSICNA